MTIKETFQSCLACASYPQRLIEKILGLQSEDKADAGGEDGF